MLLESIIWREIWILLYCGTTSRLPIPAVAVNAMAAFTVIAMNHMEATATAAVMPAVIASTAAAILPVKVMVVVSEMASVTVVTAVTEMAAVMEMTAVTVVVAVVAGTGSGRLNRLENLNFAPNNIFRQHFLHY